MSGVHAIVPTAANAQVVAFGNKVYHAPICLKCVDGLGCSVGAMVVDDDEVELKLGLLFQYRLDGSTDSSRPIAHGDNHRCLNFKLALVEINVFEMGFEVSANLFQMLRTCLFHLNLSVAVTWVNVIKLLFATLSVVFLYLAVQVFVGVHQRIALT